jgi:Zn-dependent protease
MFLPPKHKLLYILIVWILKPLCKGILKVFDVFSWLPAIPSRINLFKLAGTQLQVQRFTLFYLGWFPFGGWTESHTFEAAGIGLVYVLALFGTITLHEFCHVLVAKSYGIQTPSILLNPFGGMAEMKLQDLMPARHEFFFTVAGPLSNMVLFTILITVLDVPDDVKNLKMFTWEGFKFGMVVLNFAMAVFNFLPIFPMDGGRILRATLIGQFKLSHVKATQIICWVSCCLAPCVSIWAISSGRWIVAIFMPLMCILAIGEYKRVKQAVLDYNAEVERQNSTLINETQ